MLSDSLLLFFRRHERLFGRNAKALVAVSGGPDSVALALALQTIASQLPLQFQIAHVNHKLRGRSSDADQRFVRALAARLGWPFKARVVRVLPLKAGNLEEVARTRRYRALAQMAKASGCRVVLTAHQMNDQVETVLMNLIRGSGPDGLGGMKAVRRSMDDPSVVIARPMLNVPRSEVLAFLTAADAKYRSDQTNRSPRYFRNWIRLKLVPLLEGRSPGVTRRIAQLADIAQDERAYWEGVMKAMEGDLLTRRGSGRLLDLQGLLRYSPATQKRFLRRIAGENLLDFDAIERWRRWMSAPPTSGRIWQLRKGWFVERLSKSHGSPSSHLFWLKRSPVTNKKG